MLTLFLMADLNDVPAYLLAEKTSKPQCSSEHSLTLNFKIVMNYY